MTRTSYVLIRAYDSLDQMRERHADFYGSSAWLEGPRERVLACIDTYTTTVFKADVAWLVALSTALAPR